uniref:Protein TIC 214 n=1 Tax=Podalyria calyptrata TaxID=49834 RepID=A0A890W4Z7_9FABA|nr:Ycf1 [Podalyria calyptrata]QRI61060.1 Ycf1 [Podalyria calyptrata]
MILQSFILDNLVFLCMKIMNSVVVVGLYYGFLTTFSIGPSYLFLLRARAMQEGTEKKISATTGFIGGQLMMFISLYYTPLHLALGRPYTIIVIALPYLFFHFFAKNQKELNYGYKKPNSIRHFRIPRLFFNNLIFQLLNPPFLPNSMLIRLVKIDMFRCNNKLLFLTSSFGGWLIGYSFLTKWVGFLLVWIKQNNWIKSNVPIKYIMSLFRIISVSELLIVFLFITCLYYLSRAPSGFVIKELSEIKERNDKKSKIDAEKTSETAGTKQAQKTSTEDFFFPEKKIFGVQKPLATILFDYKRWNRPMRYIKNYQFENFVRNDISQFFFYTCQNDEKERMCFTYPPNLSTFLKITQTKTPLLTTQNTPYHKLSNCLSSPNEEKTKTLRNEFFNRAKVLDKEFILPNRVEKKIRLSNDDTKKKYLPKIYDPLLNGPYRGRIKKCFSPSIKNETYKKNKIWINKIHSILLNTINSNSNNTEFEQKIDRFYIKTLLTEICFFLNLINKFSGKSVSNLNFEALYLFRKHKQVKTDVEEKKRKIELLFDTIRTDLTDKTVVNRKKCIGIKEISKKVPRWSYKLIDELQELDEKNETNSYSIRSRKAKRVVIYTINSENDDTYNNTHEDADNTENKNELALIRYSQQPDFRRDIIKGSIRAQRRKIVAWKLCQRSVHSLLFLDKIEKTPFFSVDIFDPMKIFFMFKNWMQKTTKLKIFDYTKTKESEKKEEDKRKKKEKDEKRRIEIAEAWDSIIFAQVIRGFLLITQSFLRKYIILPSLIITKNIARLLLFQFPEWSEDFRDWSREMHIKCTYNGVQLSETEFPKKWITDGIQIKVLFPFRLKPWHRSKQRPPEKQKDRMKKKKPDFSFLTIGGMEVELPFSSYPRNRLLFFDPIFKELKKKKKKKINFFFFRVLGVLNERTEVFRNISKDFINASRDKVKWIIKRIVKSILFLNEKIKKLSNFLFLLKNKYGLNQREKDSTINKNNPMFSESGIQIKPINCKKSSLKVKEKKIKNVNAKRKKIEKKILKKNKKGFLRSDININISSNKPTYGIKRLKLQEKKGILQKLDKKLERINARLARKLHFFFKKKSLSIDIFLYIIISIPILILQLFVDSKKIIKKYIYNNEENAKSIIELINIIIKYYNIGSTNSQNDPSCLSQAYVFYKLSQNQIINVYKYNLRSVFEYQRRSFFIKNELKDYFFGVDKIFYPKLKHKNPPDSVMNQRKKWTDWIKGHSQYDLSQSRWFRLGPQKWRDKINERCLVENKDLTKCDSYEKKRLILSKKDQVNLLRHKKKKVKKQYDKRSYKSINYVNKTGDYRYGYKSPFQTNKKKMISYNYKKRRKQKLFDIMSDRAITNYIAGGDIIDMKKNRDRKFFDWIGMNTQIQNLSVSNPERFLFSKFVIFYNLYMSNPWIIPIQLVFFDFNVNKKVSDNKNITEKKKIIDIFRLSKKKKKKSLDFELETRNTTKTEYGKPVDIESSLSNQEKDIQQDSKESDRSNHKDKKNKSKNKIEKELHFLLRKFFGFQLNWKGPFNKKIINNVKVYCLLIRLINFKKIAITSIQRGELSLDLMLIQNQKDLPITGLSENNNEEFIRKTILIIEPVRLSRKNDEQFIMYQTIGPSLIHKSKRKINQSYPEKGRGDKKTFEKSIPKDQKITENKEKKNSDLPVPENILAARRCRELRIVICLNPRNQNRVERKTTFSNENKVNNSCQVLTKNKNFDREKKKLMNFKFFLWAIYRLEDLGCINRYWFNTNNGSNFSIVRIHMYPRLKIH